MSMPVLPRIPGGCQAIRLETNTSSSSAPRLRNKPAVVELQLGSLETGPSSHSLGTSKA